MIYMSAAVMGNEQWFAYDTESPGGWKWVGGVIGGSPAEGYPLRSRRWIGGRGGHVPGKTTLSGNVLCDVTEDTATFSGYGLPSADVLPELKIYGNTGHRVFQHGAAIIRSFQFALQGGDNVKYSFDWMAVPPYDTTAAPSSEPTPTSTVTFEDWSCALSIKGAVDLEAQGVTLRQDNYGVYVNSIQTRADNTQRHTDDKKHGYPECTAPNLTVLVPPTLTTLADIPDSAASIVLTAKSTLAAVPKLLTITVPNLVWRPPAREDFVSANGRLVTWAQPLVQETFAPMTIVLTTI